MLPGGTPSTEITGNNWIPPVAPPHNHGGDGGNGGLNDGHTNWKLRKLDLPTFDGTNPDGWILRAKGFFHFYRLNDDD